MTGAAAPFCIFSVLTMLSFYSTEKISTTNADKKDPTATSRRNHLFVLLALLRALGLGRTALLLRSVLSLLACFE